MRMRKILMKDNHQQVIGHGSAVSWNNSVFNDEFGERQSLICQCKGKIDLQRLL